MAQKTIREKELTLQEYAEAIKTAMEHYLGSGYTLVVQESLKNNGIKLTGLVIKDDRYNIAPTIYLDEHYERTRNGADISETLNEIIRIYEESRKYKDFAITEIKSFENIRDRLCFKLVNIGHNNELLNNAPYILVNDLAAVFFITVDIGCEEYTSISVSNELAKKWGVSAEEMFKIAVKNMERLFPGEIISLCEAVMNAVDEELDKEEREELVELFGFQTGRMPVCVASNSKRIYGAGVILYPGFLKAFAEETDADLYIIPSSVHEVMLLPVVNEGIDPEYLKSIVREVNMEDVAPECRLSDNVYYYDRSTDRVEMI